MSLLGTIEELAEQAAAQALDAPAHRPRASECRLPLIDLVRVPATSELPDPWARFLTEGAAGRSIRVTDGRGHHRPVYVALAVDVLLRRGVPASELPELPGLTGAAAAYLQAALDHGIAPPATSGAMQTPDAEAAPDTWVFEDLVWLHALHLAAGPSARLAEAVRYHVGHTQPDYTTYQPWGLAAFAAVPEGRSFAEQQLHDVRTHLAVEGGAGAVVVALLLRLARQDLGGPGGRLH